MEQQNRKPVIGVLAAEANAGTPVCAPRCQTGVDYLTAVERAGGLPMQLPLCVQMTPALAAQWLSLCDGLLLPGGGDVAPAFYGENPLRQVTATCRAEDSAELLLCRAAGQMGMPVLGICRGVQTMNVAFGGTLWQDIPTQCPNAICHYQDSARRSELFHALLVQPESLLARVMGDNSQESNTFHHQAVRTVATGFSAVAHTPDGLIEAIESANGQMLGVQWHPENLAAKYPAHAALFAWLVQKAAQRKKSAESAPTPSITEE